MLICQGPSFYLKLLVNKGLVNTLKNTVSRVMSLVLQLQPVMMSKYSKFGVDTFNKGYNSKYIIFRVMSLVLQATATCHDEQVF